MKTGWKNTIHTLLNILLPRLCAGCGAQNESFCVNCQLASYKTGAQCLFCGFRNKTGKICNTHLPTSIKQVLWAGRYDGPLKEAIWQFKYKKRKELAKPLAEMLWKKFCEISESPSRQLTFQDTNGLPSPNYIIIPIPLHFKKEHERGFNQAELLTREFSKLSHLPGRQAGFPLLTNSLLKIKETPAQVAVENKELRIKNLDGAFEVNPKLSLSNFRLLTSHTLILVDDVSTTGATLIHASRALAKAGATKIIGLVVAHG